MSPERHTVPDPRGGAGKAGHLIDNSTTPVAEVKPPNRHCENPRGWLWMRCPHGTDVVVPMKCGKCDACLQRRRAKHIARICYGIYEFGPAAKLELTSRPGATWKEIMRAWSKMIARIRETVPDAQYAAVKEAGPDTGMLHLHVIVVRWKYILQRQLSSWWDDFMGAPVVWVRKVDSSNAVYYVTKHITKDVARMRNAVTYSRGFPKHVFEPTLEYVMKMSHIPDDFVLTAVHGWGILMGDIAPNCDCFPGRQPIEPEERLWLASHSHPSWRP